MNEPKKQATKEGFLHREIAYGITGKEWLVSALVGVTGAITSVSQKVREIFHEDVKSSNDFSDHFKSRQTRLDAIKAQSYSNAEDYWSAIRKEKQAIAKEYDSLVFKLRKVRSAPILETIDRYNNLSPNSKKALYFNGAVGAFIGAAMTLSFFNGVATRDKIDKIAEATGADKAR